MNINKKLAAAGLVLALIGTSEAVLPTETAQAYTQTCSGQHRVVRGPAGTSPAYITQSYCYRTNISFWEWVMGAREGWHWVNGNF
jgi:hypothetical protein